MHRGEIDAERFERCTYLPLLGIQLQQVGRFFFIAHAEIIFGAIRLGLLQTLAPRRLVLVVLLEGVVVDCASDVCEICRAYRE